MSRRRVDRVVWGEGMLVCPQHLQQQDLYFESFVQARSSWPNPHGFGCSRLEIDEGAVKGGEFKLGALQAIFPGGGALDLPEGDIALPPAREIAPNFPNQAAACEVYVGIPSIREGTENYAINGSGAAAPRYEAWSRDVVDLVGAGSEVQVMFGRPKAQILFGNEDREEFEVIKVAEVRRDQATGFELSTDYVPPCLRLAASPVLVRLTQELLGLMLTKRRGIVESLRQVDSSRVEFTAQDVTRYLQLGAINSHIPMVRHFAETPDSTPWALYATVTALAGQLTSFSADIVPEELPTYNHFDPRETFAELFSKARALLELAMKENFIEVPLEARRDGMWIGVLKDQRVLDCNMFVLAVDVERSQQEVGTRIPQLSKIASWKQIPRIVRSAIPGAPLTTAHRPPPQIPIRPRSVYFLVDTSHEYWDQIKTEKTIAIYLPPPYDPTRAKIKLMAVPDVART